MIKIEAETLEDAYKNAASALKCSVTELKIEVVQYPRKGLLGLLKKSAIVVATKDYSSFGISKQEKPKEEKLKSKIMEEEPVKEVPKKRELKIFKKIFKKESNKKESVKSQEVLNDIIMPESFVSDQEENIKEDSNLIEISQKVKKEINELFQSICFKIDEIEVSVYDENTLQIDLKGEDAALLIGKEGYRYKALSYMIFNWLNTKYHLGLRLEIAEFLKNQEEAVQRYLLSVYESIDKDGHAQTKILDGVLVQIALKELREKYPEKYVVIRSTRDGFKYILVNDYHK